MKRESITEEIKKLKHDINLLEELMKNLDTDSSSFEEMIFKMYIETESTAKVAKFLRENGYKRKGLNREFSYKPEDVRDIILNEKANVSETLIHYCNVIFNRNKKAVSRFY